MTYELEDEDEHVRLELQARIPGYEAFQGLEPEWVAGAEHLLDVGCGSGVLTRWLRANARRDAAVIGCDSSRSRAPGRVTLRKEEQELANGVHWFRAEAARLPFCSTSFDVVTARFLFEYLPHPVRCCREFHRVLRAGGLAVLQDLDGVMFGIEAPGYDLKADLTDLKETLTVDCFAGRKLASYLEDAEFRDVEQSSRELVFEGEGLAAEAANYRARFKGALPALAKALGDQARATGFVKTYLAALDNPGTVLRYRLVTATGRR